MTIKILDGDKVAVSAEAMQALAKKPLSNIVFNVAGIYFDAFKSGEKTHEFRLHNEFWIKRLVGREYKSVIIACGYPKHGQADKRIVFKWNGYDVRTITHPHFGDKPVQVFAIDCTERIQ